MDTTDSKITFDEKGVCDHCNTFYSKILPNWHTDERGDKALNNIIKKIKSQGKGKDFDCIMGMSGGIDSSYLLYVMKEKYGLRPLVFHVDAGTFLQACSWCGPPLDGKETFNPYSAW